MSQTRTLTLRDSVFLVLTTRLVGGIKYDREELGGDVKSGTEILEWKTRRTIENVEEHRKAVATRSKMRSIVTKNCISTMMGLICPKVDELKLDESLGEAERIAKEFNETAKTCRLGVIGMKWDVQSDNDKAAKLIAGQIKNMLSDLDAAIKEANVEKIREILASTKGLDETIPDNKGGTVLAEAMRAARVAATTIRREFEKKARDIEEVKRELDTTPIDSARAFFLDFADDVTPVAPGEALAAPEIDEVELALQEMSGGGDPLVQINPVMLDDEDDEPKKPVAPVKEPAKRAASGLVWGFSGKPVK